MPSPHVFRPILASPGRLPTPNVMLSTQAPTCFQLRDIDFVTPYSTSVYLTTGVETRTSVQCAPCASIMVNALVATNQTRTDRISTTSSAIVPRP
jgi:hypothetical protein